MGLKVKVTERRLWRYCELIARGQPKGIGPKTTQTLSTVVTRFQRHGVKCQGQIATDMKIS